MRGPGGSKHFKPKSKFGPVGLAVMVLAHLAIGYALVSGMARQAIEIVKKPMNATIIEEVKIPPPPPPPPKIEKVQPQAPQTPTPPAYVPPPEVVAPAQASPAAITAVQTEKAVAPPPAVPHPQPAPAPAPARAEVQVACPGYQKTLQAALEGVFEKIGIEGTVKVLLRLKGNQVVDVTPQSGPREYYRFVQGAAKRMNCTTGGADELLVPLSVTFQEQ
jgi:protein TonB